jgi:hypothetical protein
MEHNGSLNGHALTSRDLDRVWALFHCQLVLDGVVSPRHVAEQFRRYDDLARTYPALAGLCREAIERLVAQQRKGVAV